jgi:hypothetical protein
MCTCNNFDGRGSSSLDFLDEMEYDNFLSKKMREKIKTKGSLDAGEVSASATPKQLSTTLLNKKSAGSNSVSQSDDTTQATKSNEMNTEKTTSEDNTKKGFFAKNGMYIGIGVVVVILGIYAYKKFSK